MSAQTVSIRKQSNWYIIMVRMHLFNKENAFDTCTSYRAAVVLPRGYSMNNQIVSIQKEYNWYMYGENIPFNLL